MKNWWLSRILITGITPGRCLKKVTFVPINQESSATKRYLAGDIDITESFPKNMYQKLLKDIPGQVYTPPQLGTYYYAFNTQKGPTADARVRLALSMTIDRRIMAEKVLGTGEKPAWHFLLPMSLRVLRRKPRHLSRCHSRS